MPFAHSSLSRSNVRTACSHVTYPRSTPFPHAAARCDTRSRSRIFNSHHQSVPSPACSLLAAFWSIRATHKPSVSFSCTRRYSNCCRKAAGMSPRLDEQQHARLCPPSMPEFSIQAFADNIRSFRSKEHLPLAHGSFRQPLFPSPGHPPLCLILSRVSLDFVLNFELCFFASSPGLSSRSVQ